MLHIRGQKWVFKSNVSGKSTLNEYLIGFRQLRVELEEVPEVRVCPEDGVEAGAVQVALQGSATTLKELRRIKKSLFS